MNRAFPKRLKPAAILAAACLVAPSGMALARSVRHVHHSSAASAAPVLAVTDTDQDAPLPEGVPPGDPAPQAAAPPDASASPRNKAAAGAPSAVSATPEATASLGPTTEDRRQAREAELEAIRRSISVSQQRQDELKGEISRIEEDRSSLNQQLIDTAQRLRDAEDKVTGAEKHLDELHGNEDGIRRSLQERRGVLAEVLMALQRMGRTPPPALLSRPEDALAAIRGSILAGAILPDIRVQAEALAADLKQLTDVSDKIQAERDTLKRQYASLGEEQARLNLLMDAKRQQREETQQALESEKGKADGLASQASSLEGLIKSLEANLASAAKVKQEAEAAAKAPDVPAGKAAERFADASRIAPAVHFAKAKGLLKLPVNGETELAYGAPDGLGGTSQGLSIAAAPGSVVVAPADGWVVYAGPFRSYGQVLILNAGDGYHIVMAGMERIDAQLGQFVLAGEPIAAMGAKRLASIGTLDHTSAQPILYVEFRKDGAAIDSAPWWGRRGNDEVRG